ncbi:hypothetical protein Bamb_4556 [Burkholderia ambifaria AMMD]|uniref:Uncharacterized protein n=1 Tax=Burkholderia ambifaria (strain ATCC BAA-244 / DSM 16087 / CCUG 44356 / LMG 19182 / AMMD) TaxID=339670 RepID=Q0B6W7_BURCM|nr:hypothetical protein Bamb_4556 [Burkholderia ambifaria AMMD]
MTVAPPGGQAAARAAGIIGPHRRGLADSPKRIDARPRRAIDSMAVRAVRSGRVPRTACVVPPREHDGLKRHTYMSTPSCRAAPA